MAIASLPLGLVRSGRNGAPVEGIGFGRVVNGDLPGVVTVS